MSPPIEPQFLALVFAIFSLGAQFSDLGPQARSETSQKYIKLCFDALAAAEYMTFPSKFVLQTLLLLSQTLQNEMKPQAAWVLGGTTIRVAQYLGIHKTSKSSLHSSVSLDDAPQLRYIMGLHYEVESGLTFSSKAIVWQDAILSKAFDKPPSACDMNYQDDLRDISAAASEGGLQYREAMSWLCHATLKHTARELSSGVSVDSMSFLNDIKSLETALLPHLRNRDLCITVQQAQEFYALQMNINCHTAGMCRPIFSNNRSPGLAVGDKECLQHRMQQALKKCARAYIRLRSVAYYATRSWASAYLGLTSILLLSLMKNTRNTSDTHEIQNELIDSFDEVERGTGAEFDSSAENRLSEAHKKAFAAIRKLQRLNTERRCDESRRGSSASSGGKQCALPVEGQHNVQDGSDANGTNKTDAWCIQDWLRPFYDEFPPLWSIDNWLQQHDLDASAFEGLDLDVADQSSVHNTGDELWSGI
ncbi:hypothetical protein CDD81_319 [Ophiocordyceps australis]|uniref:Xylanolytic transcriptional activator regulatory domain-containing protein n=1 Tax=Ophiocordyceps australis TaxID=1399860 RepID=A0A2C5Y2K7_9HYPO|nr:hypothetical protein CDD81_319 [Ophiocordyceps australis]